MNDDRLLLVKVRQVIDARKLPDRSPDRVWGGPGTGVNCAICGASITNAETELEIEFTPGDRPGQNSFIVHLHCFSILERERQSASAEPGAAGRLAEGDASPAECGRGSGATSTSTGSG